MSSYCGIVYDEVDEVVIERSPVIRGTWKEAKDDALKLCEHVNKNPDDYNGETVDESCAYVSGPGGLEFDELAKVLP